MGSGHWVELILIRSSRATVNFWDSPVGIDQCLARMQHVLVTISDRCMVAWRRTLDLVATQMEIDSLCRHHAKGMSISDTGHYLFPTSDQGFDYWMSRIEDSRHLCRTRRTTTRVFCTLTVQVLGSFISCIPWSPLAENSTFAGSRRL